MDKSVQPLIGSWEPPSYADIRMIHGAQRSGKTTTGVAYAVGDYHKYLTGIVSPNGEILHATALTKEDMGLMRQSGVVPDRFHHVRVYSGDGTESKIIRKPKDWLAVSPVRIFANFHLYGVRYVYITLAEIVEYLNTNLISNAWVLSDESVMTDARNSMELAGKVMAIFGATVGKRNLHMCLMAQYNEMVERRFRLFKTMTVECSYDNKSQYVTCDIKKRNEPVFTTSYWGPQYWGFFNTAEIVPVPQYKIDKVMQRIREHER